MNRAELKAKAIEQLGGNIFAKCWLMSLLMTLIVTVINNLAGGFSFIVFGPVSLVLMTYFKSIVRDRDPNLKNGLNGIKQDIGGTILLGVLYTLFVCLWTFLFIIPGLIKSYAYSMAFYLKDEHPEWNWKQCIDESQRLMDGHKMDLFVLDLSFIGWYIVGYLTFGIGLIWVNSYHYAARINYFDQLYSIR